MYFKAECMSKFVKYETRFDRRDVEMYLKFKLEIIVTKGFEFN